jgi:hypothetical protein
MARSWLKLSIVSMKPCFAFIDRHRVMSFDESAHGCVGVPLCECECVMEMAWGLEGERGEGGGGGGGVS